MQNSADMIPRGPFWFSLIYHWTRSGRGNTGLTLPFLVGALYRDGAYRNEHLSDESVLFYLLDDFQKTCPKPYHVEIYRCIDLREPVAAVYTNLHMDASEASELRHGEQALYVWTKYSRSQDIQRVAKAFWEGEGLNEPIRDHRFTCIGNKHYVKFRPKDEAFIDETKGVMADAGACT